MLKNSINDKSSFAAFSCIYLWFQNQAAVPDKRWSECPHGQVVFMLLQKKWHAENLSEAQRAGRGTAHIWLLWTGFKQLAGPWWLTETQPLVRMGHRLFVCLVRLSPARYGGNFRYGGSLKPNSSAELQWFFQLPCSQSLGTNLSNMVFVPFLVYIIT